MCYDSNYRDRTRTRSWQRAELITAHLKKLFEESDELNCDLNLGQQFFRLRDFCTELCLTSPWHKQKIAISGIKKANDGSMLFYYGEKCQGEQKCKIKIMSEWDFKYRIYDFYEGSHI